MTVEELKKYDIFLIIDRSGSMTERDCPGNMTRWDYSKEVAQGVAAFCETVDEDGISVGIFGNGIRIYDNVKSGNDELKRIYSESSPSGGTDTALALRTVANKYFDGGRKKPIIIIFITDGVPNDKSELIREIVGITKKIKTREEIGITFFQIGKANDATKFLKELDDDLISKHGAAMDIVDTKTQDELDNMSLQDAIIASLTD